MHVAAIIQQAVSGTHKKYFPKRFLNLHMLHTHTHVKRESQQTQAAQTPFHSHLVPTWGNSQLSGPSRFWQSICSNKLNYVACSQHSLSRSFFGQPLFDSLCHCLHSFSLKFVAENLVGNSFCRLFQKANQIASHVTCLMASFNGL